MIPAYDEILNEKACDSLGRMLDFAAHSLHIDSASMMKLFIASDAAMDFGRGDIRMIAGMSGIELAYEVMDRSALAYERTVPRHGISLSPDYWLGYCYAYAQWRYALDFSEIIRDFDAAGFTEEYSRARTAFLDTLPYDINGADRTEALRAFGSEFTRAAASRYVSQALCRGNVSRLKQMRIKNGLSQRQLAAACSIPVRTLQQYEQRQKDISKARFEYIISLSTVLNCDPSLLMEKQSGND